MARAVAASGAASLLDGLLYQSLLFLGLGTYGVAALCGAIAGAFLNFSMNRHWTFAATDGALVGQGFRYAAVSSLNFLGLRTLLWLLVEVLCIGAPIAWFPAKVWVFVAISYPMQRLWVFRGKRA